MTQDEQFLSEMKIVPVQIRDPAAVVPEQMLDAALRSYAALEAELAPVYRKVRDAEGSRDAWRCIAAGALVALVIVMLGEALR